MGRIIQMRRGLETSIPALADGEIGITTDKKHLFYGADGNNQAASVADMNAAIAAAMAGAVMNNDFVNSFGANGYQKLPSGLIIQWGNVSSVNDQGSINYPIAFPTGVLCVIPVAFTANNVQFVTLRGTSSLTTFTINASASPIAMKWIALGY